MLILFSEKRQSEGGEAEQARAAALIFILFEFEVKQTGLVNSYPVTRTSASPGEFLSKMNEVDPAWQTTRRQKQIMHSHKRLITKDLFQPP